jgi:hypothetical protein
LEVGEEPEKLKRLRIIDQKTPAVLQEARI